MFKNLSLNIILGIFILLSFYGHYYLFTNPPIDALTWVLVAILAGFQISGIIWLYQNIVGWDKFEKNGIWFKRKKDV